MKSDIELLKKIIEYCDDILDNLRYYGEDEETFLEETRFQHSCSFCVFQIGECAKQLSDSFKSNYPQIDWRGITGLRNIIGHAYGDIRLDNIWITLTEEVPVLKRECEIIIEQIGR